MCRIAGIISNGSNSQINAEKVKLMCESLAHGGPDDEGLFIEERAGLAFGHRRLSIIDLSQNGHQPMSDSEKKVWITFNGEIYNYPELKAHLIREGAIFRSKTDTEVIILAYMYWGMAAFSRLRGIFAFALYDAEKSLTYLVRDSSGIKPLYYHVANDELSFASEVKAFKVAGIARDADINWKIRFLAYGHLPEPYTTLEGVYSLPKGEFLCWHHQNARYEIHPYRVMMSGSKISGRDEAMEVIRNSLTLAVGRQLLSDAPIGVFLSGGIDSSLLTLLANNETQIQLKTISIFFQEKSYDERMYQELVLQGVNGQQFAHLVTRKHFEASFPQIIEDMDMPTTDGINTWFISKYAHEDGLKAVLSGIGADELFGGYPSFNRIRHIKKLREFRGGVFKAVSCMLSDPYQKIAYLSYKHPIADYLLLRGLYAPADIASILDAGLNEVEDILFSNKQLPHVRNYDASDAAWFETNLYMQNQLLRDTDVMGMSHGLEIRVPFLDEDFKRLTESIIPSIRFDPRQPKKLLIDSFSSLIPESVWKRTKMGFTFPLQEWLKDNREFHDENLYAGKKAKQIIKSFKKGRMHWSKAFALFQLEAHG